MRVGDVDFHVQTLGRGAPLALCHGLVVGSLASWYFSAAPALARSHRVLLHDLRGHGLTPRTANGYDVATQAGDLLGLLHAHFGDEPVDLAGHSFGALIVLAVARMAPERVRRLALVEAPLPPSRFDELMRFVSLRPEEMVAGLPPDLRALVASGGRRGRRFVEHVARLATETTCLADLAAEPDIDDEALRRVSTPTLLVYGTRSACAPVGERLVATLPHASLRRIEGGHFLLAEAAASVTAALVEHFDG